MHIQTLAIIPLLCLNLNSAWAGPGPKSLPLALGTSASGNISLPGHEDRFTFTASMGQRFFLDSVNLTNGNSMHVRLESPSGQVWGLNTPLDADAPPFHLLQTGTHTLVVSAPSGGTGPYSLRLVDCATATVITMGATNSVVLNPSSRSAVYRFDALGGQKVSIQSLSNSGGAAQWALYNPANQPVASAGAATDLGTQTISLPGTYILAVSGTEQDAAPVNFSFKISDVTGTPVSVTGLGTLRTGTLAPAEVRTFPFTAPAGTRLYLDFDAATTSDGTLSVIDAGGNAVWSATMGYDAGPWALPSSGNFTLKLEAMNGGNFSFRPLNLGASAALAAGSTVSGSVSGTTITSFRFSGTPGQRILFDSLDETYGPLVWSLVSPSLQLLLYQGASQDSPLITLTEAGEYTLLLRNDTTTANPYQFRMLDILQSPVTPLLPGVAVNSALPASMAARAYRFDAVAGSTLFFDDLGTDAGIYWQVFDPENGSLTSLSMMDQPVKITKTGTHVLCLFGTQPGAVNYALRMSAPLVTALSLSLGAVTTGTLTEPGQEHRYTFSGTAGQRLYYDALQNDGRIISVRLLSPRGSPTLINQWYTYENGPVTLTDTGAYTLIIGGLSDVVGSYAFRLIDVSVAPVTALAFNTTTSGSNSMPLSASIFRFSGTNGQRLFFDSSLSDSAYCTLFDPANGQIGSGSQTDFEITLSRTGTYLLLLQSSSSNAFGYNFKVLTPSTASSTLAFASTVTNYLAGPGQRQLLTFSARMGARVFYDGQSDNSDVTAELISPAGETLVSGSANGDLGPLTIKVPGVYTLALQNHADAGRGYQFQVRDVAAQGVLSSGVTASGTLTPGAAAAVYRLSARPGQRVLLESLSSSGPEATWKLYSPDDEFLLSTGITADLGTAGLRQPGTYVLVVAGDSMASASLSYNVRMTDVTDAPVAASGFGHFQGTLGAGATDTYSLTAAAGTHIYIDGLNNDNAAMLNLIGPDASPVLQNAQVGQGASDPGVVVLPASGTYSIEVTSSSGGNYSFQILNLETQALPLSYGMVATGQLDEPFQATVFALPGKPGDRIFYDGLESDPDLVYAQVISADNIVILGSSYYWYYGADYDMGPVTVSAPGTNYVVLSSAQADPTHYRFRVLDLNQAPVIETALGRTNGFGLAVVSAGALSLTGRYVDSALDGSEDSDWTLTQVIAGTRSDAAINFHGTNWGLRSAVGLSGGTDDNWQNFSVQWDGTINIQTNGTRLYVQNQGNSRLWIDLNHDLAFDASECVSNGWATGAGFSGTGNASAALTNGSYKIRLQYSAGYVADVSLLWDGGKSVEPYAAQPFRFAAAQTPLFLDSLHDTSLTWAYYSPGHDYSAYAWAEGGLELTPDQPGTNIVILANSTATAQPYKFRVIAPQNSTNTMSLASDTSNSMNAGEDRVFTFTGVAGQRLYYDALDAIPSFSTAFRIVSPSGAILTQVQQGIDVGPFTLSESGTYSLWLHNNSDHSTTWNFRLLDVNAQPLLVLDAMNNVTANLGTRAILYRINGVARLNLYFDSFGSGSSAFWSVFAPDDQSTLSTYLDNDMTLENPPLSGVQVLAINGTQTNGYSGSFRVVPWNHPPLLTTLPSPAINEEVSFSLTNSVTDPEADNDRITFSLDAGAPAGATVDPNTGVFSWTPTELQGPGSYNVTIRSTDDGIPPLSDSKTFTITVNEVNKPPVLTPPATQTLNEGTALSVSASATDPDVPTNSLVFGLSSPPAGMTINPVTGAISWTPAEAQGPGAFTISVYVVDTNTNAVNSKNLGNTNTFVVNVNEVNVAPTLPGQTNRTIDELTLLAVTNTASDSDLPVNPLTYSLLTAPAGALISTNGVITWTPTEAQGPGSYTFTTKVSDTNSATLSSLSATNSFTVTVKEVNAVPELPAQTNRTINELTLLTVVNTATDTDDPVNPLTYSLLAAPPNASINASGVISWTPTEAQGPGSYTFTTKVSDTNSAAGNSLSATNSFTVTVNEINTAPVPPAQSNRSVDELALLTVTNTATDADSPLNSLTYSLVSAPAGVTINPTTGVISWTPAENQGPGTFTIIARVTDTNSAAINSQTLAATNQFDVTVNEINSAPVLPLQADRVVNESVLLSVNNAATDSDSPNNPLTYTLLSAPAGASISASGVISWTPGSADAPSYNTFVTRVVDTNSTAINSKSLSATNRFQVYVAATSPSFRVISFAVTNSVGTLTWASVPNQRYRIYTKTNLQEAAWSDLGTVVTASGNRTTVTLPVTGRFYRILLAP